MKRLLSMFLMCVLLISSCSIFSVSALAEIDDTVDYLKIISNEDYDVDFAVELGVINTGIKDEKRVLVYAAKDLAQECPKIKSIENYNFKTYVNSGAELGLFDVSINENKNSVNVQTLESGIENYHYHMNQIIPLIRKAEKNGVKFDFTVEHKDGAVAEECIYAVANAYEIPEWLEVKGKVGKWTLCTAGSYFVTEMAVEIRIGEYTFYSFGQYKPDYLGIFVVNGSKAYTLKDAYDKSEINDDDLDKVIGILGAKSDNWRAVKDNQEETTDARTEALHKLSDKIYEAQNSVPDGSNYTHESRQRVWDAINYANELLNSESATTEEILAQIEVLQQAVDALEAPDINADELWKVIERADYFFEREERYTEISYAEFKDAIMNAKVAYYYGQTQKQVDKAKEKLETALNNLEKIYKGKIGDVNKDDTVNIIDVTIIQKYLAGADSFDKMQKISADYNDDMVVNIRDATKIQIDLAYKKI